jgi:hypothetical protein
VKNLLKQPRARFYLAGKALESDAIVIAPGQPDTEARRLNPLMRRVVNIMSKMTLQGWAFAILMPARK